ncbi:MAG: hypothetical protein LBB61_08965 [Treponema sp.]|jgi:hypothetical protein|nr:hypothetical protein [Treponema sp.]
MEEGPLEPVRLSRHQDSDNLVVFRIGRLDGTLPEKVREYEAFRRVHHRVVTIYC